MGQLVDQDQLLAQIDKEHRESPHPLEGGVPMRLHVTLHTVAETQIRLGAPAEVAETLQRLMGQGASRHDAIHAICNVVSEEVVQVMGKQRAYDEARYVARLKALTV
jgi:hypothetical protein